MTTSSSQVQRNDLALYETQLSSAVGLNIAFSVALVYNEGNFFLGSFNPKTRQFFEQTTIEADRVSVLTPQYPRQATRLTQIDVDMRQKNTHISVTPDSLTLRAKEISDIDLKASLLHRAVCQKLITVRNNAIKGNKHAANALCLEIFELAKTIPIDAFKTSALYQISSAFTSLEDLQNAKQAASHIPDLKIRKKATDIIPKNISSPFSLWELVKSKILELHTSIQQ